MVIFLIAYVGIFIGPILTFINIYKVLDLQNDKTKLDIITFIYGSFCMSINYMFFYDNAPYHKSISSGLHEPIFNESLPTILIFSLIGFISYAVLKYLLRQNKLSIPPLMLVLCISGVYLGIITCVFVIIQLSENMDVFLCLLPFNYIIYGISIVLRISRIKADEQKEVSYKNPFLNKCNSLLVKSENWRISALILFFPAMGIIVMVLMIFGQQPDSMIKAFTYTSDWYFSTMISPPNHYDDGHYLCTVAAGGHKVLVKPLRYGTRGGRRIIVNRQLCVANAFEQIIEERTPRFHHFIRNIYDRYGLPLSRYIRTPIAADITYIAMKPLEYLFLFALYLFDLTPEKRISRQYLLKDVASSIAK